MILLLLFSACDVGQKREFITTDGTRFMQGSTPYYFAGTNFWYGAYLGSPGATGDRGRLTRELDALKSLGLTNLRLLGGSEQPYMRGMLTPPIQAQPGIFDEELLEGLDVVLAEMAARDMRAVIFLTNYWEWSGGMAQYVAWSRGLTKGPDPEDPDFDWASFMDFSATFYSDSGAQALYQGAIERLVRRVNSVTGERYINDPTIMSWELANEPRPGTVTDSGMKNVPAYYAWIDSTARYIRSLDPNHLITTGSEGIIGSLLSPEIFLEAHSVSSIDYATVHVWPYNWKWFDPMDITSTIDSAEIKATDYVQKHFGLARSLNKPLVLEEFGLARDSALISPSSPVTARDRYFRTLLGMVYDSAAAGAPIAGSNFWAWSGEAVGKNSDGRWKAGDPFLGDPPHEPQGINSIFRTDSGTLDILSEHARMMNRLGARLLANDRGEAIPARSQ